MDYKNTHFPQYRKLQNGLRFYKINSIINFEEIQILGKKVYYFKFIAEQYPEKLRIMDMLKSDSESYLSSNTEEWERMLAKV